MDPFLVNQFEPPDFTLPARQPSRCQQWAIISLFLLVVQGSVYAGIFGNHTGWITVIPVIPIAFFLSAVAIYLGTTKNKALTWLIHVVGDLLIRTPTRAVWTLAISLSLNITFFCSALAMWRASRETNGVVIVSESGAAVEGVLVGLEEWHLTATSGQWVEVQDRKQEMQSNKAGATAFRVALGGWYRPWLERRPRGIPQRLGLPMEIVRQTPWEKRINLEEYPDRAWTEVSHCLPIVHIARLTSDGEAEVLYAPNDAGRTYKWTPLKPAEYTRVPTDIARYEKIHAPWGLPSAPIIVARDAYIVGYDPVLRIPRFVCARLNTKPRVTAIIDVGPNAEETIETDPAIPVESQPQMEDYVGSGFFAQSILRFWYLPRLSLEERRAWHFASVTFPRPWQSLPRPFTIPGSDLSILGIERESQMFMSDFAEAHIWLIAGPAFIREREEDSGPTTQRGASYTLQARKAVQTQTLGEPPIWVPTHHFEIIVRSLPGRDLPVAMACLIPYSDHSRINAFGEKTSVRQIEEYTGLDFLSRLSRRDQDDIELSSLDEWPHK